MFFSVKFLPYYEMKAPKVLDLFSGCGGFSLGFHLAGYNIIAHAEWDKACCNTLKQNFDIDYLYDNDVRNPEFQDWINELPDTDVIIAGPPCQGFSVAGVSWVTRDRKHILNNLYLIPVRVAALKKPKVVVIENVPAVLYRKNIPLVALAILRLKEFGYKTYPKPPDANVSVVEAFYTLTHNIVNALTAIGVTSKKKLVSDPENIFLILNNISGKLTDIPSTRLFNEFYNDYWKKIKNHSGRSRVSKTRVNEPVRIQKYLQTKNITIKRDFLVLLKVEINNFVKFLQEKGLILDMISFGELGLISALKVCNELNLPIDIPRELEDLTIGKITESYSEITKKIQKWGGKIRKSTILCSEKYGAPEKRNRAFVIAFKNTDFYPVPPKPTIDKVIPLNEVFGDLPTLSPGEGTDFLIKYPSKRKKNTPYIDKMRENSIGVGNHRARAILDPFYLLRYAMLYQGANDLSLPFYLQKLKKKEFVDAWKRLDDRETSRVIVAHLAKDGNAFLHPLEERTITVREAARIQGFPDNFIFPTINSFSEHFRQIGNALSVQMAEALARSIGNQIGFTLIPQSFFSKSNKSTVYDPKELPDYRNAFRGLRGDKFGQYAPRKFSKEDADYFSKNIEEFNLGKTRFSNEKGYLYWERKSNEKRENISNFSLKLIKKITKRGFILNINEIQVNNSRAGFLGRLSLEGRRDSWFVFINSSFSWSLHRSIVAHLQFPPIRECVMMNQSHEFFLHLLSILFNIENPIFLESNQRIGTEVRVSSINKFLEDTSKEKISKRISDFKLEKAGTKIDCKIMVKSSNKIPFGLRIETKVSQFGDNFTASEVVASKNAKTELFKGLDENNLKIKDLDRLRSNLMNFFCHLILAKQKLISKEDFSFYWGKESFVPEILRNFSI